MCFADRTGASAVKERVREHAMPIIRCTVVASADVLLCRYTYIIVYMYIDRNDSETTKQLHNMLLGGIKRKKETEKTTKKPDACLVFFVLFFVLFVLFSCIIYYILAYTRRRYHSVCTLLVVLCIVTTKDQQVYKMTYYHNMLQHRCAVVLVPARISHTRYPLSTRLYPL